MNITHGYFVISLDFELFWGVQDKYSFEEYGDNVRGVWTVIPRLLALFEKYNIQATFATVGAMMAKDFKELSTYIPSVKPDYTRIELSPYGEFLSKLNPENAELYFGKPLVDMVAKNPNHQIGTHTFSHYYCLEDGQNRISFEEDLNAALQIAKAADLEIKSFVFPRHQLNESYIEKFKDFGISIYRGTEKAWYHTPAKDGTESLIKRAFRYANYYLWMGSHHCIPLDEIIHTQPYNIPSSMWLRPYRKKWEILDRLRLIRIKSAMTHAAKQKKVYHLWWHPHEMGIDQDQNFIFLEKILKHYKKLNKRYNFESVSMEGLIQQIEK